MKSQGYKEIEKECSLRVAYILKEWRQFADVIPHPEITKAVIKEIKYALFQVRKDTLEAVEREVKLLKTGLVDAQDDTVDEVLSLISGMKGGKE